MKKILLITLMVFAAAGCKKFLEPLPQNQTIPTRVDQLSELLLTALPDPSDASHKTLTAGYLDVMSDDVQVRGLLATSLSTDYWYAQPYITAVAAIFQWQPDYSQRMRLRPYAGHDMIYKNSYHKLEYANSVLDYVEDVSGTRAEKDYAKAQGLALRAFYYLNLVNIYGEPYTDGRGGMGIPMRLTGAKENRPMTRNTVGEVYDQITADLTEAVRLWEGLSADVRHTTYRASMPMAMLLLARAYLYMGDWAQAEHWSQRLIDEWPKFEVNDLNTITESNFDPADARKQKFWPAMMTPGGTNPDLIWAYGASSDITELTTLDLSQANSFTDNRIYGNGVHASMLQASKSLVDSYDDNDLRLRKYLVRDLFSEYRDENGSVSYTENQTLPADHRFTAYKAYAKVNLSYDKETGLPSDGRFKPVNDARSFGYTLRITEAWLILAEAQAQQGKAEASGTLREVQAKRFVGGTVPTSYTTGNVLDQVKAERRREFCFESLRWFDLRRWGKKPVEHVWYDVTANSTTPLKYTLTQDDPFFTLPMSVLILDANPNLTQVPLGSVRMPQ